MVKKKASPTKKKTTRKTPVRTKKPISKKQTTPKKTIAKKKVASAKKATPKKQTSTVAKKKKATKSIQKKASAKPTKAKSQQTKRKTQKSLSQRKITQRKTEELDPRLALLKRERRKPANTPPIFKIKAKKHTPIVFSLEDVRNVLQHRGGTRPQTPSKSSGRSNKETPVARIGKPTSQRAIRVEKNKGTNRVLGAASAMDILGFAPQKQKESAETIAISQVPSKFLKYYKALIELRQHFEEELDIHTHDSLKEENKDHQDMSDGSTESFDKDFALSLVSNEQEALNEINEAIKRVLNGTYGKCEITGKPINRERLSAVPFTRFSVEGQAIHEKEHRRINQRDTGIFSDNADAPSFNDIQADE